MGVIFYKTQWIAWRLVDALAQANNGIRIPAIIEYQPPPAKPALKERGVGGVFATPRMLVTSLQFRNMEHKKPKQRLGFLFLYLN